jgi:hypothetical protein
LSKFLATEISSACSCLSIPTPKVTSTSTVPTLVSSTVSGRHLLCMLHDLPSIIFSIAIHIPAYLIPETMFILYSQSFSTPSLYIIHLTNGFLIQVTQTSTTTTITTGTSTTIYSTTTSATSTSTYTSVIPFVCSPGGAPCTFDEAGAASCCSGACGGYPGPPYTCCHIAPGGGFTCP